MTTTPVFQMIPLAAIEEHTRNVRREVGDLSELADSIREQGLLEPIVVAPGTFGTGEGRCPDCDTVQRTTFKDILVEHDHASLQGQVGGEHVDPDSLPLCPGGGQPAADTYRLIAGHRRTGAAALAGLAEIPSMVRHDLKTEGEQVLAMLVENLQRSDLTPIEEATAYEQLGLFGYKPAQIAKKTGRSKALVDRRLSLRKLDDGIQDRVQAHELTLGDAEALVEFADDPKATAELERYLGTSNWRWALQTAQHNRTKAESAKRARAQLVKDGVTIVAEEPDESKRIGTYYGELAITAEDHAKCPHHVALEPTSATVVYLCLDPDTHPKQKQAGAKRETKAERTARLAAEKEREELQAAIGVAGALRRAYVTEFTAGGRQLTAEQRDLVLRESLMATMAREDFYFDTSVEAWLGFAGVDVTIDQTGSWQQLAAQQRDAAAAQIERRDPVLLWLALLASDAEGNLTRAHSWSGDVLGDYVQPWLRFLTDLGYELTAWESERLATVVDDAPAPVEDPDEAQRERGVTQEALTAASLAGIPSQVALQPGVKTPKGRCSKCLGWAAVGSGDGVIGAHKGCAERGHFALTLAEVIALEAEEPAEAAV